MNNQAIKAVGMMLLACIFIAGTTLIAKTLGNSGILGPEAKALRARL